MKIPLWKPSAERIKNSNMARFMEFVNLRYGKNFKDYFELYNWSIENIPDFWASVWDFVGIKASVRYEKVVEDLSVFPGARWFPGARLNFAENLLKERSEKIAIKFRCETEETSYITYRELYETVSVLSSALKRFGAKKGDRICAYMPNIPETVQAMLATTSFGGVWASCGSELGVQAVIDRLSQLEPKILFTVSGYFYKGKVHDLTQNVRQIVDAIPSLERIIVVPYAKPEIDVSIIPKAISYHELLTYGEKHEIQFEQLPFDHPVYIMFSSGTTGKPKCMVQGAGVLINHLKELIIHADIKPEDTVIYMTAPSWMMWNWLVSALAVGATIFLFDGNPLYPDLGTMWRLVDEERITFFGTSATYINLLMNEDFKPKEKFFLDSLKSIGQTGSPLSEEGFRFVYRCIKEDVHFNSLSGGTDINGCFVIGSPILPVYAGELQSPALGMKVKAYDEQGNPVYDVQGELVCEAPSPSMPLCFLNDPDMEKYKETYFSYYPGVWRHGDYVMFHSDTGGVTFFGRSDSVLKPSGVRIGVAEIYNIVEKLPEISDSLAIGQNFRGDQRIILFVKLAPGYKLTEELKDKIKRELREKASPRHVPAIIMEVPDIPYTFNMKKVESAVTNIVNGRPVTNRDALVNPESLDYFEKILPIIRE
ncbi:MAG: acetoacetate--CoA ligase [Deltaproteobacteria bacterium]|nr:acetoacetate--CoA ligase [Deltaproteobacteria bacterium]